MIPGKIQDSNIKTQLLYLGVVEHTHTPDIWEVKTGIPGIQKELGYRDLKPDVAI